MARRDIRDVTPLGIKAINDNFIDLSYKVFGTASFTTKIDKQVKKNTSDIADVLSEVGTLSEGLTTITASIDNVTIGFERSGGVNLLLNSGFVDGLESWAIFQNEQGVVENVYSADVPSGRAIKIPLGLAKTNQVRQLITKGFNKRNKEFKFSGWIRNTATASGTTNPYAGIEVAIYYADGSIGYVSMVDQLLRGYFWKYFNFFLATDPTKDINYFRISYIARDMSGGDLYLSSLVFEEGRTAHSWKNADNEAYSTFHTFTPSGYSMKDDTGEALLTPMGVANEQNIVLADNVEENYPMKIPFHLGTEVSSINQVKLKWKNYPFRTYSKGAASGGGATSGDGGSWSSTVGVFDWTQGLGADTDTRTIDSNNLGTPHSHFIASSKLGHRHSVAVPDHQHSTPAHVHPPEFGILEFPLYSTRYAIAVWIDGVYRVTVDAGQGEVELSNWITTSGWHEIELRSIHLKRISATVFLKTYIRR